MKPGLWVTWLAILAVRVGSRVSMSDPMFDQVLGRPFVKWFALSYRTIVCSVCLSVTLVYCGQTVERIRMPVGMKVGLNLGHIVLDGDPAPPRKGAQQPPTFAIYGRRLPYKPRPMSTVANRLDRSGYHLVRR